MRSIRALVTDRVRSAPVIVVLVAAAAIVAGLLAMHGTGAQHASHAVIGGITAGQPHGDALADSAAAPAIRDTHCAGDCSVPVNAPEHDLLAACVLALVVMLLLVTPPDRRSASIALQPAPWSSRPAGRPSLASRPSLPMLSVSRT
ncbi:hypothetical protein [Agromyces indicus]|uniref:DUF2946 domain-containing protein n=1 Tax=Agromyces indicus TaxID=758919 RepID=A0ABU1FH55_9MICO|nr:hypothetical protein [Agromyces indicus]MDR5690615.1 hypothetical protein [Agromyces indicus]